MHVLLAVGDPSLGDDGVALRVAELLGPRPDLRTVVCAELFPEVTSTFADADIVVVVEADARAADALLEPVAPAPRHDHPWPGPFGPAELVARAAAHGFHGRAFRCRVPVKSFADGIGLTMEAEIGAEAAARRTRAVLDGQA